MLLMRASVYNFKNLTPCASLIYFLYNTYGWVVNNMLFVVHHYVSKECIPAVIQVRERKLYRHSDPLERERCSWPCIMTK